VRKLGSINSHEMFHSALHLHRLAASSTQQWSNIISSVITKQNVGQTKWEKDLRGYQYCFENEKNFFFADLHCSAISFNSLLSDNWISQTFEFKLWFCFCL